MTAARFDRLRRLSSGQSSRRGRIWALLAVSLLGHVRAEEDEPRTWVLSEAHKDLVAGLAYSPDGKTLASASRDGTIKLWDLSSGRVRSTMASGLTWPPAAIAFAPDGKVLAASRAGGGLALWEVASGRKVEDVAVPAEHPKTLLYSRDGKTLALVATNGTLRLWDVAGRRVRSEITVAVAGPFAVSPDLQTVAMVGRDEVIQLGKIAEGREFARLEGHVNHVWSLAFSPDGKLLASGAGDASMSFGRDRRSGRPSEVKLWDLTADPPRERASLIGLTFEIPAVAFSPDGRLVAAGGFGEQVRVWETASGRWVADLVASCHRIYAMAFSGDGTSLAVAGLSPSISVWDTRTWVDRPRLAGRIAYALAYTPDGKTLAAGLSDGTVALRDVASGRVRAVLQGHAGRVRSLAVSPDGKRLAAGGADGQIAIWDPGTGHRRGTMYYGHAGEVTALAFSRDGQFLASGGKDTTVRLWAVAAIRQVALLAGHQAEVSGVAFSPDGTTLVSTSHDGYLRFWDVRERRAKATVRGHTYPVTPSREETRVVDGETVTYAVAIPGPMQEREVPMYSLAYSPDGKLLATGDRAMSDNGGAVIRDAGTGKERASFRVYSGSQFPHLNDVNALEFSPDGKIVASAGYNTIRLSDARTGEELATIRTQEATPIRALSFSPDGRTLATTGDQVVQLWKVEDELKKAAH